MGDLLFSARGLSAGPHRTPLLHDIDLELRCGGFLGIVGPNGAGKSSLLMALLGFLDILEGSAEVLGRDIRNLGRGEWAVIRKRIGYLPQRAQVDPYFPVTAGEVVLMGRVGHAGLLRPLGDADRRKAENALESLGMGSFRDRPFGHLSGGEQQKIHLARILAQEPEMIFLDEPMAGLDLKWQERLGGLIGDISRKRGAGIVIVTHELQHLPPACDRVALLRRGRILAAGQRDDVLREDILSELYECRVRRIVEDGRTYLSPWIQ
ncbi:MAG: metal ABC transporter ATP-binding protein [Syntrophales bacterium]